MPSRSSFDENFDRTVSSVRRSRSVSVAVSTEMCPAIGSHSKVWTIRSGATTSRYSPRNPLVVRSGAPMTNRQRPPGRTSILSTVVVWFRGPHHRGMRLGSVIALNTRSRGASNSRVMRISLSEGNVTFVVALLVTDIFLPLVFLLQVAKNVVELCESFVPRAAVWIEPLVELF